MLSSRPAVRLTTTNSTRAVSRLGRVAQTRVCRRFQSTNTTHSSSPSIGALFAAGIAGGAAVLGGTYAYYHFSGAKKVVDSAKSAHQYLKQTRDSITERVPKNPNEVLSFLRGVAKHYASLVPGAVAFVDSSFDMLDELHETHRADFDSILQAAFVDVTAILKNTSGEGLEGLDVATLGKLMGVLGTRVGQLNALARRAGADAFARFEERYPHAGQVLGSSYAELRSLARRGGPEAMRLVDEAMKQVQEILGGKFNPDALNRAKDVFTSKTQQLREMLWDRATEETKDNPELQGLLRENRETFVRSDVSSSTLKEVLEWAKQAAREGGNTSKEKLSEMREYLQDRARGAQSFSLEGLQEWLKGIPGSEKAQKYLPTNVKVLDAKELVQETVHDVHNVLQEKAEKARRILGIRKE